MLFMPVSANQNKIVISQPMFFPWIGIFEQIRLSDIFVHYDDVQFPHGRSFMSRVQIKTHDGIKWLTISVKRKKQQLIQEVLIDDATNWKSKHLKTLEHNYRKAPFVDDMIAIVEDVYSQHMYSLSELNICGIEKIAEYFNLNTTFLISSTLGTTTHSSAKLLDICLLLNANIYITGHGAKNYLDHELFEQNQIQVEYMDYERSPYQQLHGAFDPHVSILDLIANHGRSGIQYIHSKTKPWRDFINE